MIVVITGTPGTGKTAVAKEISKLLHAAAINERDFALKHGIGRISKNKKPRGISDSPRKLKNKNSAEIEIPLGKLRKKISSELKKFRKSGKSVVIEGHLLCEIPLKADLCIVLHANPELLEKRLKKKHYSDEKILDNVFCEQTNYCLKNAKKNCLYIAEFDSSGSVKNTSKKIILLLKRMQTNKNHPAKHANK